MEDTVTYVADPQSFETHLANLQALRELGPARILPNHGDPEVIASGGYPPELIDATEQYIRTLLRCADEPALRELPPRADRRVPPGRLAALLRAIRDRSIGRTSTASPRGS